MFGQSAVHHSWPLGGFQKNICNQIGPIWGKGDLSIKRVFMYIHSLGVAYICPNLVTGGRYSNSIFFQQQQNAMGSLHNIDFGVFWARNC